MTDCLLVAAVCLRPLACLHALLDACYHGLANVLFCSVPLLLLLLPLLLPLPLPRRSGIHRVRQQAARVELA